MQYRRSRLAGGCFFFTLVTYHRRPIFADHAHVDLLRLVIRNVMLRHPFTIDAIVVLPDHLHCVWTLPDGDADFSTRWRLIKGNFSRGCQVGKNDSINASRVAKKERTIWQRRFWEHEIRDERDFRHHVDYIHFNPVKHGLVSAVQDWQYSSFNYYCQRGIYPQNWCATGMEQPSGWVE